MYENNNFSPYFYNITLYVYDCEILDLMKKKMFFCKEDKSDNIKKFIQEIKY